VRGDRRSSRSTVTAAEPLRIETGGAYGFTPTVIMEGPDVYPEVREAGEAVLRAQRGRVQLSEDLDARVQLRAELVERLSDEEDQQAAVQQLTNFRCGHRAPQGTDSSTRPGHTGCAESVQDGRGSRRTRMG
jgi:hypothetical protein